MVASSQPPPPPDIWISGLEHVLALRELDLRFADERDRRYTEVGVEKEKALKIKETADLTALQLARDIQTYKDEKANELRSQIERERSSYATQSDLRSAVERLEALIKPLSDYILAQQGREIQSSSTQTNQRLNVNTIVLVLGLIAAVVLPLLLR